MIINLSSVKLPSSYVTNQMNTDILESKVKLLILDFETLDKNMILEMLQSRPRLRIVVTEKLLSDRNAKMIYDLNCDYYIANSQVLPLVKMLIRRYQLVSPVKIDHENLKVKIFEENITFSKKEFAVFAYLYERSGEFCTRKELMTNVLGYHADTDSRLVDVYIKYIRQKLEPFSISIETARGKGYMYQENI